MQITITRIILLLTICAFLVFVYMTEVERRLDMAARVTIVTYHDVVPEGAHSEANISITATDLKEDLLEYKEHGYETLSFAELAEYVSMRRWSLPDRPLIITFDDNWKGQQALAVPLLVDMGYTATFFINSGRVGTRWEYMGWTDIKELKEMGMEIGGHTVNHRELQTALPLEVLEHEVIADKRNIESVLGSPITVFAYPYNTVTDDAVTAVKKAGYAFARTGERRQGSSHRYQLSSQIIEE